MTITTLILLLATSILAVTAVDDCPNALRHGSKITNCCDLRSNFNFANKRAPSGVYLLKGFCEDNWSDAQVLCDNYAGAGGWIVIQKRYDRFNRDWMEYEDAFGYLR